MERMVLPKSSLLQLRLCLGSDPSAIFVLSKLMRKGLRVYPKFRFPSVYKIYEFVHPSMRCVQGEHSTSREKRTSKNGICIVLKLVSIEYQTKFKGCIFWQLCS